MECAFPSQSRCKNHGKSLVRIDSVSTKSQWKTFGSFNNYVWIEDFLMHSQHFMVEHKMYCTLAAELSKDWNKGKQITNQIKDR